MNASMRIAKESRQLMWPWALVTAASALALVLGSKRWEFFLWNSLGESAFFLAAVIGLPLLTMLPFGLEFEHRTMTLALAQPVRRETIWADKQWLGLVSILPAATMLLVVVGLRGFRYLEADRFLIAAVWVAAMCVSAPLYALIARSAIGGMALNAAAGNLLFFIAWTYLIGYENDYVAISPTMKWTCLTVLAIYAGATSWLARRMFLRLQAIDGEMKDDVLAKISSVVVPNVVREALRSKATTPTMNLIRRELHLLEPVWILTLVEAALWAWLVGLNLIPAEGTKAEPPMLAIATMTLCPVIALLAGGISLGEERNSGIHEWHMTLPPPTGRQWLVKLGIAEAAALAGGAILPRGMLMLAGWRHGDAMMFMNNRAELWVWPTAIVVLTAISFWTACMVKGTVRSTLWTIPLLFMMAFVGNLASRASDALRFNAAALVNQFMMWVDPIRLAQKAKAMELYPFFFWIVPLIVGVYVASSSYRLFRGQRADTTGNVLRSFAPLLLVVFSIIFLDTLTAGLIGQSWGVKHTMFGETHMALDRLAAESRDQPMTITADKLAQAAPLSEVTRYWLGDGTISIQPNAMWEKLAAGDTSLYAMREGLPGRSASYKATVTLRDGVVCTMTFQKSKTGFGILATMCR